ncbi:MAG: histidine kinase dimerization/phospho-acceptor domain-containing protein [Clostridia bacterium]
MIKSTQIKIILMIIIVAIIMFGAFGIYSIAVLEKLQVNNNILNEEIVNLKLFLAITIIGFIIICLVIIWFSKKIISKPILKLIQSAKQINEEQDYNDNSRDEIDELTNAFDVMNNGLKENFNEVTRQKKQMETILLHMNDGILAFNMEGNIIHINPAAKKLLNIGEKEQTFEKIFNKIDENINMEKLIYLEDWTTSESKANVGEKYLKLFFAPFKDENERPSGIIVLIQDITEHVKLDNMRKEFIADVSHELKTPLTSIMGYAETLSTMEYDKEIQEKFLNVITSEAVRMTKLVNDLLTLSKHDDTNTKWEKTEFDLGELVKKCQEYLQIEMDKKQQKVECFVTANVPNVYADKDGIERVVLNILSNSVKYTGKRRHNKNICRICI